MCTKFQVDILKNDQRMAFSRSKMTIFHAVPWDFNIIKFLNFARFRPFKKCFRVISRVLGENGPKNMYHASQI